MKAIPLFLQPVFKERIWGGEKLRGMFHYDIPTVQTGECWGISAHPHGPCTIINGPLEGKTLDQAWAEHPELFGHHSAEAFPLLTKILDAKTDLSVQVHPNDAQAQAMTQEPFGKTECWYVIAAEPGAQIVYGHHAASPEEFRQMVEAGKWDELLRHVDVKAGDFFYVPSGTIHAIGGGVLILETQQSSDITYRVYDYDRKDAEGNLRDLHIEPSIAVTTYPHQDPVLEQKLQKIQDASVVRLVSEAYFSVYDVKLDGHVAVPQNQPFLLFSVLEGEGRGQLTERMAENGEDSLGETRAQSEGQEENGGKAFTFKKGDHFIIPANAEALQLKGHAHLIVSHP